MDYTKMLMTGAAAALLTVSGFAADAKAKPAPKAAPKAAAPAAKPAPAAKKADPFSVLPEVLAEMNGKKITRQELVNDVKKMSPDGKIPEQLTPDIVKAFAYEWTNRNVLGKLLNKAMADAKFTMSTKEIEQSIADQIKTLPAEYQKMMIGGKEFLMVEERVSFDDAEEEDGVYTTVSYTCVFQIGRAHV